MIGLLDHGGRVEADESQNASRKVIEAAGLSKYNWTNARLKLQKRGLLKHEKSTPSSKILTAIWVDREALSALSEAGELSPRVQEALERLQEREAADAQQTGEQHFLAEGVGAEIENPDDSGHAVAEVIGEETPPAERRLQDELRSIRVRRGPTKRRAVSEHAEKDGKMFEFNFRVEGRSLSRSIRVKDLGELPVMVRLLLGIGQVNTSRYDFYKTEEERRQFVLRVVNKGVYEESEMTDETALQAHVEAAIASGYLCQNGKGPELTGAGIDFVRNAKFGKAKLGQKNTEPKDQTDHMDADAETDGTIKPRPRTPAQMLGRARLIA